MLKMLAAVVLVVYTHVAYTQTQPLVQTPQGNEKPLASTVAPLVRNQPPHIKLKLGHYKNQSLGIGVTIDLTEATANVADIDPAKVRFDGDPKVWKLQGQHGPRGRIDYLDQEKRVVLHVWDNGRRSVYVRDPATGKASEEIFVYRDGDADPL